MQAQEMKKIECKEHERFTKKHQPPGGKLNNNNHYQKNIDTIHMACPWPFQAMFFSP